MYRVETLALTPELRSELERRIADTPGRLALAVRFVGKTALTVLAIAAVLYAGAAGLEYAGNILLAPRRPCVLSSPKGWHGFAFVVTVIAIFASALAAVISQTEWRVRQCTAAAARRALSSGVISRVEIEVGERHQIVECEEGAALLVPDGDTATVVVWLEALHSLDEDANLADASPRVGRHWTIDTVAGVREPLAFTATGSLVSLDYDTMGWIDDETALSRMHGARGIAGRLDMPFDAVVAQIRFDDHRRPHAATATVERPMRPLPAE